MGEERDVLRVGIVGLPNVGKSTLFNALLRSHKAEVANYPFCTIDRNVGVIAVPNERLEALKKIYRTGTAVPTTIEYFDIAGLVRGAHRGEGLGNQFLAHIREVDAIIEVVRCFQAESVVHVEGMLDPVHDIETIKTELALADLATIEKRREKVARQVKVGDKAAAAELAVLEKIESAISSGTSFDKLALTEAQQAVVRSLFLLTTKPMLYAANVGETDLGSASALVNQVRTYAAKETAEVVEVCAELEAELADLTDQEAADYLSSLGVVSSGVSELVLGAYRLLDLITFFTGNEKEVHAWAIKSGTTAQHAAGLIHTDMERGFIAAEVIQYKALVAAGSIAKAREHGLIHLQGRDYVIHDGDVIYFRFHV
jgi:hypothetical protein